MTEAKAIRNSVEGRDVPRGPSATEIHARTLRLVEYSTSAYARGYRVGAHAVADTDAPPPAPAHADRETYKIGVGDGRDAYAAMRAERIAADARAEQDGAA